MKKTIGIICLIFMLFISLVTEKRSITQGSFHSEEIKEKQDELVEEPVQVVDATNEALIVEDKQEATNKVSTVEDKQEVTNELIHTKSSGNEVSSINGVLYNDLESALNSAIDGDVVRIIKTATLPVGYKIDKDITLDLNGQTITISADKLVDGKILQIAGNITIDDTSASKDGVLFVNGNKSGLSGKSIYVSGTLNLKAGSLKTNWIKVVTLDTVTDVGFVYIAPQGVLNVSGGAITCDNKETTFGGTFINVAKGATMNMTAGVIDYAQNVGWSIKTRVIFNQGIVNISGGEIKGKRLESGEFDLIHNGVWDDPSFIAKTKITGGTFVHTALVDSSLINNEDNHYLEISGGTFTCKNASNNTTSGKTLKNSGEGIVSGGTFISEGWNALENNATIGEFKVAGGVFSGTNGINNTGKIDEISNAEVIGKSWEGIYNNGTIGKITNSKLKGVDHGIYNDKEIGEIVTTEVTGENLEGIYSEGPISKIKDVICKGLINGMDYENSDAVLQIHGGTFKQEGFISSPESYQGYGVINYEGKIEVNGDTHFISSTDNKAAYMNWENSTSLINSGRFTSEKGYGISNYGNGDVTIKKGYFKSKGIVKENALHKLDVNSNAVKKLVDYDFSKQTKLFEDTQFNYNWLDKVSTITFNVNHGQGSNSTEDYVLGEKVKIPSIKPTMENKSFSGWKLKNKLYKEAFVLTDNEYARTITFYAQFRDNMQTIVDNTGDKPIHAVVEGLDELLKDKSIVTDADRVIINNQGFVELILQTTSLNNSSIEANSILSLVGGNKAKTFFKLDLLKILTDENNVVTNSKIMKSPSLLKVIIPLDDKDKGKENYVMYRLSQTKRTNTVEELNNRPNENGEYIIVNDNNIELYIKELSIFALGYEEPKNPPLPDNTPETGDNYNVIQLLIIQGGTLIIMTICFVAMKKTNKRKYY